MAGHVSHLLPRLKNFSAMIAMPEKAQLDAVVDSWHPAISRRKSVPHLGVTVAMDMPVV